MKEEKNNIYTCEQYRNEMILLALKLRFNSSDISEKEKKDLLENIRKIETAMCMD